MIDRQQRQDWQDERVRRDLVPGHPDIGRSGPMAYLGVPRLLLTTLPADALRPALDFDDDPSLVTCTTQ